MKSIIVLGAGMMGSTIAADLSGKYSVTSADISNICLEQLKDKYNIKIITADLSSGSIIKEIIKPFDIVVCAVPGFMGFNTLRSVIEAGKDVVDISFFDEDPFLLNDLAIKNNVTAIVDCGVAPGLSNIILGHYNEEMDVKNFVCMVGGLPVKRNYPFEYKAPFSPIDVIEEYTRPARIVENGKVLIKPALSDPRQIETLKAGTLTAFNTDGLRTLIKTMNIPDMAEKTLRYPKHYEYIKMLSDSGFFSSSEVEVKGVKIKPIDVTSQILLPLWQPEKDEKEFTYMELHIKGMTAEGFYKYKYTIYDEFDEHEKRSSMARTTGFTCASAVNLIAEGLYDRKGVSPPEYAGGDQECFMFIINYLEERSINLDLEIIPVTETLS